MRGHTNGGTQSQMRNAKLPLNELVKATGILREKVLEWEKKGLTYSEKVSSGKVFDVNRILNLKEKLENPNPSYKYTVLSSKPTDYTVIELFSGAGGLALGLSNAGFQTKLLVEFDKDAAETLKTNRPEWNVIPGDIKDVDFTPYRNKIDVVAGGFPCQSFSYAGNGKGFGDMRGTLFSEFARCLNEVQPKVALAENVRGLLTHDNGRTLGTMLHAMDKLGYNVSFRLLRAQFYDVAQKRERLIIFGVKKGLEIPFIFPKANDYIITLGEALEGCPSSEGATYPERKAFIMSQVPEGGNWRDLPIRLQKEYMKGSFHLGGGKTGMARRLSMSEPSLTLVCTPAQAQTERCHPTETRPITIRESARIQSFPDDWSFVGSVASKYKQIGNAVPVNLAFHVGRCLIAMLSGKFKPETMVIQKAAEKQLDWVFQESNSFFIKEMEWINSIKPQEAESCRP